MVEKTLEEEEGAIEEEKEEVARRPASSSPISFLITSKADWTALVKGRVPVPLLTLAPALPPAPSQ